MMGGIDEGKHIFNGDQVLAMFVFFQIVFKLSLYSSIQKALENRKLETPKNRW